MFYAGGCASCHATPGQDDKTKLGGGLGLKSPFGTFYVPNISPDPTDGIGKWSEADFVTAMQKGTSPDGRHYFPAFPYTSYQRMRVEDVRDLFAHIKTLPAVQGKVRDHDVPFPFNVRRTLGGWKFLFLDGKPFQPDPIKVRAVESRRVSGERPRPLRRMPFAAQSARRHRREAALRRRAESGRRGLGSEHHAAGARRLLREGHRLPARNRQHAGRRFGRRRHDAGDPQYLAALREGSRDAMAAYIKSLPAVEGPKKPEKK